jgi:predicted acyl esterase
VLGELGSGQIDAIDAPRQAFGQALPWHRDFVEHPAPDAFWMRFVPSPEALARTRMPVLQVTGQHDLWLVSALQYHQRLTRWGHGDAGRHAHLVIGPWNHTGSGDANPQVGSLRNAGPSRAVVRLRRRSLARL